MKRIFIIAIALFILAAAAHAAPADCHKKEVNRTLMYLLCLQPNGDQSITHVDQPYQTESTRSYGLAASIQGANATEKPPDGPCPPGGGGIDYPPVNPSGPVPCPDPGPNFPGDQVPYVTIPDQSWAF